MKRYCLFVDESGDANLKTYSKSPYFIVGGLLIQDNKREQLRQYINHIKYKYWGSKFQNIQFHSQDIGTKSKDFHILDDPDTFTRFCKDLNILFNQNFFELIAVLIDKEDLRNKQWDVNKVYKKCYRELVANYVRVLFVREGKGTLIAESSKASQDIVIYQQFFSAQSNGIPADNIDHVEVKTRLTALSFVTKHNFDSEEEAIDMFCYAVRLKQEISDSKKNRWNLNCYDETILKCLEQRLIKVANYDNNEKSLIAKKIRPITIIGHDD